MSIPHAGKEIEIVIEEERIKQKGVLYYVGAILNGTRDLEREMSNRRLSSTKCNRNQNRK